DAVIVPVHLDARAVELPFENRRAQRGQRLAHVGRTVGEHWLNGTEELEGVARERWLALGQDRLGHRSEVAGEHDGATHSVARETGRARDGLGQHAVESTLTDLADGGRG